MFVPWQRTGMIVLNGAHRVSIYDAHLQTREVQGVQYEAVRPPDSSLNWDLGNSSWHRLQVLTGSLGLAGMPGGFEESATGTSEVFRVPPAAAAVAASVAPTSSASLSPPCSWSGRAAESPLPEGTSRRGASSLIATVSAFVKCAVRVRQPCIACQT